MCVKIKEQLLQATYVICVNEHVPRHQYSDSVKKEYRVDCVASVCNNNNNNHKLRGDHTIIRQVLFNVIRMSHKTDLNNF